MKKLLYSVFTVALLFFSQSVFAGNDNKPDNGNTKKSGMETFVRLHIDKLKADIEITDKQEKEIGKLLEKFYKDREKSAKKSDKKEQINGKRLDYEAYIAALNDILTEEQQAELERKAEERRQNRMTRAHDNANEQ